MHAKYYMYMCQIIVHEQLTENKLDLQVYLVHCLYMDFICTMNFVHTVWSKICVFILKNVLLMNF